MKPEPKSTDSYQELADSPLDLPVVAAGEGPLDHPEPNFEQMLAHAKLLLSWQGDDFLEKRRALMQPERFVL